MEAVAPRTMLLSQAHSVECRPAPAQRSGSHPRTPGHLTNCWVPAPLTVLSTGTGSSLAPPASQRQPWQRECGSRALKPGAVCPGLRPRLLAEGQGSCSGMPPHHILCGNPLPPSFEPSLGVPADHGAVFTWVPSHSPQPPPPRGLLWPHRSGLASMANCQHGSRTLPAAEGPGGDHSLPGCHLGQGLSPVAVSP